MTAPHANEPVPPIASAAEAAQVIGGLAGVMDALVATLDEESVLVRAGRLSEVLRIAETKGELARRYLADAHRLQASLPRFRAALPDAIAAFRDRQVAFRALLQTNLTVLATAHAVSEGIMRGVADEIARKTAPQAYGASGRPGAPDPRHARPLTLSRAV
jgi:hypothetical protein